MAFNYLPSFCLPGSLNFVSPKFVQSSTVECVLSCESDFVLVIGIGLHFVSPWYDPSRLTGRKTSNVCLYIWFLHFPPYGLESGVFPWKSLPTKHRISVLGRCLFFIISQLFHLVFLVFFHVYQTTICYGFRLDIPVNSVRFHSIIGINTIKQNSAHNELRCIRLSAVGQ